MNLSPAQWLRNCSCRERLLRKQDRRQLLAALHGGVVRRTPRLEELHQLLARAVLVPLAVALDDLEQMVGGRSAVAAGIQGDRQVEARLMIERVGGDLLLQFGDRTERARLFGK